jgi:RNA polymerase sigma-70 factor (ECF subfamily)
MPSDETTWKCMKEGSKDAFLKIYKENYNTLFCYGFTLTRDKELTKDCIQEIFLEIWKTRVALNPDVQNVRSYLCTWLRRKTSVIKSIILKARTSEVQSTNSQINQPSYEELLVAFQETTENKERLSNALNHLTNKQLEIIKLRFYENLSYAEISAKTLLSNRTLYNTIFLAIQQLRLNYKLPQEA